MAKARRAYRLGHVDTKSIQSVRKGRECIIPGISRTYHFGGKGLNVGGLMQAVYFEKHAINDQAHVQMDAEKMYKDNYEKEIHQLIR